MSLKSEVATDQANKDGDAAGEQVLQELKVPKRLSLATWLFGATLSSIIVAVAAVALLVDHLVQQQAKVDALNLLQVHADTLRDALDRGMERHYNAVKLLSELKQVTDPTSNRDRRAALDSFALTHPEFAWVGMTDASGRVLASNQGLLEGVDVSARPWFKAASRDIFVGDVKDALLLAGLLPKRDKPWRFVDFAFPVRDETGALKGVIGAHLDWEWAARLREDLASGVGHAAGAEVMVLGANGTVLLGLDSVASSESDGPDRRSYLVAKALSKTGNGHRGPRWQIVVKQPVAVALAPYATIHAQTAASAGGVFLLLLPVAWWLARRLSRPLVQLTDALSGASPMPRDADILYAEALALKEVLVEHETKQALQATALQLMASSLEKRVTERTRALADANDRLFESMDQLETSRARLSAILHQSPDAFVCADSDGKVTDWNPAAEAMFGWSRDQIVGKKLSEISVFADDWDSYYTGLKTLGTTSPGGETRKETTTVHRDGTLIATEVSVGEIDEGDERLVFAFLRDIRGRLSAQEELKNSRQRLEQVLGTIPAMVGYFDLDARCQYSNGLGRKLCGFRAGEEIGLHLRDAIGENNFKFHEPHLPRALAGHRTTFSGSTIQDGRLVHYQVHMLPEKDSSGKVTGFYLMTFDVTAVKEAQLHQERAQRRLRSIADNLPVMISYLDADCRLQFLNRTFEDWSGLSIADALGRPLKDVIGEGLYEQRRPFLEQALKGQRVEFEIVSEAKGIRRILQTTYVPDFQTPEEIVGVYTLTTDITGLRAAEQRMADLALTDTLTNLANRRNFELQLPQALDRAARTCTATALIYLDVDYFKSINDRYGHAAGDAVLTAFAQRLSDCVRRTDLVARLSGDEFVVLAEGLADVQECHLIAQKINAHARRPIAYHRHRLTISTSIGIAFLSSGETLDSSAFVALADAALYRTKGNGRDGYTVATPADTASELPTTSFAEL